MHKRFLLFIFLTILLSLNACDSEEPQPENSLTGVDGVKEILVAKDEGGGLATGTMMWCGNTSFLIYRSDTGTELLDFNGKRVMIDAETGNIPSGCTPDGKWVIYYERKSWRFDKGRELPENLDTDSLYWQGYVDDLYRYEVATGRRQRIAVTRDRGASGIVSPDGTKIFLGGRHNSDIEMPEPRWEKVWLTREWLNYDTRWFPDSSGIVTIIWDGPSDIGVEVYGGEGWAAEFGFDIKMAEGININSVDRLNRVYLVRRKRGQSGEEGDFKDYFLRCEIKDKELLCDTIGHVGESGYSKVYGKLLSDGTFIFSEDHDDDDYEGGDCIRRFTPGRAGTECIAEIDYDYYDYRKVSLESVSPDGRWMAFNRSTPLIGGWGYRHDLFVKELLKSKE